MFLYFFCSIWQVSSGRRGHSLSMPETRTTEAVRRRTGRRLPAGTSEDVPYKLHHRSTVEERSQYQTKPTELVVSGDVREEEEEELDLGEIVDGLDRDSSARTEMSGSGDDGDVRALLRFMLEKEERSEQTRREKEERDEERRREREQQEADDRREKELRSEEARRAELREMFLQMRELDDEKATRLREADAKAKEKRELQQEKLKGLGSYRERTEMTAYLEKFEMIMRECEIEEGAWPERLFPRLTEKLCARLASVREERATYGVVKSALLKTMGETSLTYGTQLFELTGEAMKAKTAGDVVDTLFRITRGLVQECKTVSDAILAVTLAAARKILPPGGKTFMDSRKITSEQELRDAWEDWMLGRQKGNYFKLLGVAGGSEVNRPV